MAGMTERFQRDQRLAAQWALLENQRKLLAALNDAGGCSDGMDVWYDALCGLRDRVACELYLTCQRIWDESAKEGIEGLNV